MDKIYIAVPNNSKIMRELQDYGQAKIHRSFLPYQVTAKELVEMSKAATTFSGLANTQILEGYMHEGTAYFSKHIGTISRDVIRYNVPKTVKSFLRAIQWIS